MSFETSVRWLKAVGILLIALGAVFALTTTGPLSIVGVFFVDLAVLPVDGAQSFAATETRLLMAIVGGLTAGVGAAIWMVTRYVYETQPDTGRKILLTFILIWFAIDSLGSVLSGAWFNAVLNTGLLVAMILPLVWVEKRTISMTEPAA